MPGTHALRWASPSRAGRQAGCEVPEVPEVYDAYEGCEVFVVGITGFGSTRKKR